MSQKRHPLFILKDMLIFEELLESYSQLRKRRYSFSEDLLVEGALSNFQIGKLGLTSKEEANALLQSVRNPRPHTKGEFGNRYSENLGNVPSLTASWTATGTLTVAVVGAKGKPVSIKVANLIPYLENWSEAGVSEPKEKSVEGGGFSPALNIGEDNPNLTAAAAAAIKKLTALASDELKEPLQAEGDDLMARVLGESEKTNTTLSKVINAFGAGDFDLSVQAVEEFVSDLGSLADILQTHKDSGERCLEIENGGQRQVLNRFFFREEGDRLHYGTNDGSNPPGMMGGFKHAGTIKSEKDFIGVSNRDRAYGIAIATKGGVLKDVLGKFSESEATICGELDPEGNRRRIIESAKTAGQGFYTARSQLAEVADQLGDDINRLQLNPGDIKLRSKILKTLSLTVKASEKHIDAFRKTVLTLDQHKLPLVPEHFTAESLAREFSELESDFSTLSIEIALKLVSRSISLSQNSRLSQVLKARGNRERRSQELLGGGSIQKTTGFQNIPESAHPVDTVKGDTLVQCTKEGWVEICKDMGSNLPADSIRNGGLQGQVSIKTKGEGKDVDKGNSDLGTQKEDNVDRESSKQVTDLHIQALEEQGMNPKMSERIREAESRQEREVSYANSCFKNIRPEVKKNADDNIESLKADAKNLPVLIDRLRSLSRNAKGQDALSFESNIKFLEDFSRDPEGLMKVHEINTREQLSGHARARAITCLTVLAVSEQDRVAKHIRDVTNIGCATAETVISMESFGRERIEVLQSQLVDEWLVKLSNGEYGLRTTPSGALASYNTYESEDGVNKERTCFVSSTRENKGVRTGVTVSGAHFADVGSSLGT